MAVQEVIILGGGGHAVVVADLLGILGHKILGIIDPSEGSVRRRFPTLPFLSTSDEWLLDHATREVGLALGVGQNPGQAIRSRLYERLSASGFNFPRLVHPISSIAADVVLGPGVQIMAGAVVQARSNLGHCALVNTCASVDHECRIGPYVHIAPGAILCGEIEVGEGAFIGAGATIVQGVTVGDRGLISAGALVLEDVAEGAVVSGLPAKPRARASSS